MTSAVLTWRLSQDLLFITWEGWAKTLAKVALVLLMVTRVWTWGNDLIGQYRGFEFAHEAVREWEGGLQTIKA